MKQIWRAVQGEGSKLRILAETLSTGVEEGFCKNCPKLLKLAELHDHAPPKSS